MEIRIADTSSDAEALGQFLERNLTPAYISHSELQGYRAAARGVWSSGVRTLLQQEIRSRLGRPRESFPSHTWSGVVEGRLDDGSVVGLAMVSISFEAMVPFAVIEDLVVDTPQRGSGHGTMLLHWIIAALRKAGVRRAFLESGAENHAAHRLFHRLGFESVSVVLSKDL